MTVGPERPPGAGRHGGVLPPSQEQSGDEVSQVRGRSKKVRSREPRPQRARGSGVANAGTPLAREGPRAFLRARKPHYFSDSSPATQPRLDRPFLEYFISRLTSRSQEADFETFARRLCERELCPNLLPHTGPTGGGDSKVDSETYPVSLDIADAWYVGEARAAATERWAFAFSAKADWRSKLRSDIGKMAATGRDYARYFFVTSQYVRDKTRAGLEDEYRTGESLEVRILDLSWILERVFAGGHEDLAVDALNMDVELAPAPRLGPNDSERAARAADLEERIAAATGAGQLGPRTVGLALESAIISRESERSREETEGKLDRAARLASDHGLSSQRRSVTYQRAWTAYWWFEDGPAFADLLMAYEADVRGTTSAFELERLANLCTCARIGISDRWQAEPDWLAQRTLTLDAELDRLASNETAPSAALNARVTQLLFRLSTRAEDFEETLRELNEAIDAATGLAGFAYEPLADLIGELGAVVPESAEFDALHARLVEEVRRRTGDVAAGERYVDRAAQLYRAARWPEAITAAGRALPLLYGEESRGELLRALDLIGEAYLAIGLPWAARGSWLLAANLAGPDVEGFGRGFPRLVVVLDRLRAVELELGRLAESLAIHRLYRLVAAVVAREHEVARDDIADADVSYEMALANALLNLDEQTFASLQLLPDYLASQDLPVARAALVHSLGYDVALPEWTGVEAGGETAFMTSLRSADGGARLRAGPVSGTGTIETRVLGVRVVAAFEGGSPAKEAAESILGAIESVLATAAGRGVFGFTSIARLTIRPGHFTAFPWRIVSNGDDDSMEIAVSSFDPAASTLGQQGQIQEAIIALLARVIDRWFHIDDLVPTLHNMIGAEGALARAASFTGSFVTAGDLYDGTRTGVAGLLVGDEQAYPSRGAAAPVVVEPSEERIRRPADLDPDGPQFDLQSLRHDEMRVDSVIDVPVWDRAGWTGLSFMMDFHRPPLAALVFTDLGAATTIWKQWNQWFGDRDASGRLRLSIVTDIDSGAPFAYRAVVGPSADLVPDGETKVVLSIARVLRMDPDSDENLRAFRADYERARGFWLGVSFVPPGGGITQLRILGAVRLSQARFVAARDITENDLDTVAVDAPEIPRSPSEIVKGQVASVRNERDRNPASVRGRGRERRR